MRLSRRILSILLACGLVGAATSASAQTVTAVTGAADYDSGVVVGPDGLIYVVSEYRGLRSFNPGGGVVHTGPSNNIDGRQLVFYGAFIATAELYVASINRNLGGVQRGGIYRYPTGCAATPDAIGCAAERITIAAPSNAQQHSYYGVVADATNIYATNEAGRILRFPRATCTAAIPCDPSSYEIAAPGVSLGALQIVGGTLYVAAANGILSLPVNCVAPCAPAVLASLPGAGLRGLVGAGAGGLYTVAPSSDTVRRVALDGSVTTYVTDAQFVTPSNLARASNGDLYLTDFAAGGTFWRIAPIVTVPTLGELGMIALAALVALLGAVLAARHRRIA